MLCVQHRAQGLGVRIAFRIWHEGSSHSVNTAAHPDQLNKLNSHDERDADRQWSIASQPALYRFDIDVEHHDDEQEQHHDGADVNEHQNDGQELRLRQQPQHCALEERQNQEHDGVNRVS